MADGGRGGDGGNGNGGDAYAGAGTGGDGGRGGDGGTASANAGSFDMSNAMNGSSNAAAGIMMVAQNSGASSLIQQGVTVQANLNRSEEHTSELQSLMRISYAVFRLKKN